MKELLDAGARWHLKTIIFSKLKVFCRIAVGENPMKEIEKRPGMDPEITRSFIMTIRMLMVDDPEIISIYNYIFDYIYLHI